MYHNFFIHSSVSGYLGCFYVLAIVNSAAVKNGIHVPLKSTHLTFLSEHQSNKNLNLIFGCLHACMLRCFSHVWFFATLWIVASQVGLQRVGHDWATELNWTEAPLSMEILQARILEWVAMLSSMGSSWPRDRTGISYVSHIGRRVLYHWHHLGRPFGCQKNSIICILANSSYYTTQSFLCSILIGINIFIINSLEKGFSYIKIC